MWIERNVVVLTPAINKPLIYNVMFITKIPQKNPLIKYYIIYNGLLICFFPVSKIVYFYSTKKPQKNSHLLMIHYILYNK